MNVCDLHLEAADSMGRWRLYPIGDLHCDTKMFNEEKFKRYVQKIAEDPACVWISVGDYIDGTTPDHKFFNPQVIAQDILLNLENYVDTVYQRLRKLLAPLPAERGIMLEGNHDRRGGLIWSGLVGSLARDLGVTKLLGYEGMARINVKNSNRKHSRNYFIHARHGSGGGMKPGGKINRFQDTTLATADADVYIQGHIEDAINRVLPIYTVTSKGPATLETRQKAWITAAGFYRGRIEGVNSYVAEKGYPSTDEGVFYLELHDDGTRACGSGRTVTIERKEFI